MNNVMFQGVYSAIFSLYDENLNVKKDSVRKLVSYNLENGIKGFYVGGGTGECYVLPSRTRKQMLETVKEYVPDNTPIIAHVGASLLEDVEDLITHANSVGVNAISSLPPSLTSYYSAEENITYYRHIAALSNVPVMAYVTPILKGDPVDVTKRLMEIDNVIGIKLTIPNYYTFERIKQINDGNINLLNGPDETMLAGLSVGADGAIGTTYNLLPKTSSMIYECFKQGNMKEALAYQNKLNRVIDVLLEYHSKYNIAGWKSVLTRLGIDPGYTVHPASMPTNSQIDEIFASLKAVGLPEELKDC